MRAQSQHTVFSLEHKGSSLCKLIRTSPKDSVEVFAKNTTHSVKPRGTGEGMEGKEYKEDTSFLQIPSLPPGIFLSAFTYEPFQLSNTPGSYKNTVKK